MIYLTRWQGLCDTLRHDVYFKMSWMRSVKKRRKILVPQSDSGRHVDFAGFMLCFMSVLLLSCGLILIGISLWSIIRKTPYYVLLNVKLDVPYFALPAGILSCSSFWIAAALHNNRENYRFLHLLILLLTVSLVLITTGACMGMLNGSSRDSLGSEFHSLNWADFNETLQHAFSKYNSDKSYALAWDKVHTQLECCGLNSTSDWKISDQALPSSCCFDQKNCFMGNTYRRGCLSLIKRDLLWQKHFLVIHCYIVGTLEGIMVVLTGTLYYWSKVSSR